VNHDDPVGLEFVDVLLRVAAGGLDDLDAAGNDRLVFEDRDADELLAELAQHQDKPPLERLAAQVIKQAQKIFPAEENAEKFQKLQNRLLNDGILKKLVR